MNKNLRLVLIACTLSSCGQLTSSQLRQVETSQTQFSPNSGTTATDGTPTPNVSSYFCSGRSTITPQLAISLNYSGYYSVCRDKEAKKGNNFLITGNASNADAVCIFPAQSTQSGSSANWVPDPTLKTPLSRCNPMTSAGYFIGFSDLTSLPTLNAGYIVKESDQTAMSFCLQNNLTSCPSYSYGEF